MAGEWKSSENVNIMHKCKGKIEFSVFFFLHFHADPRSDHLRAPGEGGPCFHPAQSQSRRPRRSF